MQNINLRNLFIAACVLKVASALTGWYLNAPWTLGFTLPLLVMIGYMWLGTTRRNDEVSDEKFADSCYYLGFIFTIASISVALMDLPNIGTHIQDIAVRFGAAMLSTVLGLSVRVSMVTFRKDLNDAIYNAEEGVVEASIRFRDQLGVALDRMKCFESDVDQAARLSVERVNLQVESLSRNHADQLATFFAELTTGNQASFTLALAEVKGASMRLSESVNGYAIGMRSNLESIEAKVTAFSEAITNRLQTTTFPDDYFVKQLEQPLGKIKTAADAVYLSVNGVSESVNESSEVLSLTLRKLRDRASKTETALESVSNLATQQQQLLEGSQGMMSRLEQLGTTLQSLDKTFERTVDGFSGAHNSNVQLKDAVKNLVADSESIRREVRDQLSEVAQQLLAANEGQQQNFDRVSAALQSAARTYANLGERFQSAAENSAGKLLEGANANLQAAARLAHSATVTHSAADMMESAAKEDAKTASAFSVLAKTANAGIQRVDAAVEQLNSIAHHLSKMNLQPKKDMNSNEFVHISNLVPIEPPYIAHLSSSSITPITGERQTAALGQQSIEQTGNLQRVDMEQNVEEKATATNQPRASA